MKNVAWIVAGAIVGPLVFVLAGWAQHALAQPTLIDAQTTRTTEIWDHKSFVAGPTLVEDAVDVQPVLLGDGSLLLLQPHAPTAQRLVPGAAAFVAVTPQPEPRLDHISAFASSKGALLIATGFQDTKIVPIARSWDRATDAWSDVPLAVDDVITCAGPASADRALVMTQATRDGKLHSSARLFDVATRAWSTIDSPPHDTYDCVVASDGAGNVTLFARVTFPEGEYGVVAMPLQLSDGTRAAAGGWRTPKRLDEDANFAASAQYFASDGWFVMHQYVVDGPRDAWRYRPADVRRETFDPPAHAASARAIAVDSTHLLFTGGEKRTGDERRDLWHPVRVADASLLAFPDKLTVLPPMHLPRSNHFAALLADGRVLVGGGLTNAAIPNTHNILDKVAASVAPLGLVAILILAWRRFRPAWWALLLALAAGVLVDVALVFYVAASSYRG
jgi:hypothetical protein